MKIKNIVAGLAFTVLLAASVAVAPLSVMSISTYAEETSEGPEHANTSATESSATESSDSESEIPSSGKNSDDSVTYEVVTGDGANIGNQAKYGYDSLCDGVGSTYAFIDDDETTWRIYMKVSEEDLKNYKSAYVYIKNWKKVDSKIVKLTTNKAYKHLNSNIEAGEGYYFIVFVIENVTGYLEDQSNNKSSHLTWTSIEFEQ